MKSFKLHQKILEKPGKNVVLFHNKFEKVKFVLWFKKCLTYSLILRKSRIGKRIS